MKKYLQSRPEKMDVLSGSAIKLDGGVCNNIFKVDTKAGPIILKQPREKLLTPVEWYSNRKRIINEIKTLKILSSRLPLGTVPNVIFFDQKNYILAMSMVIGGVSWKSLLFDGIIDKSITKTVAKIIAFIHIKTLDDDNVRKELNNDLNFQELRIAPFYLYLARSHKDIFPKIENLLLEMESNRMCLTHGDYSPKNILISSEKISIIDFETSYFGDPTFDIGFLISHIILKAIRATLFAHKYLIIAKELLINYQSEIEQNKAVKILNWPRAIMHFAVCLLARVDGVNPINYLSLEQMVMVREIGRQILIKNSSSWNEVWLIIQNIMNSKKYQFI